MIKPLRLKYIVVVALSIPFANSCPEPTARPVVSLVAALVVGP